MLSLLGLLVMCTAPFMYAGFRATRDLPTWARTAATSIPPVVLVGSVITLFGLTICKEADTATPSQQATCNTTSSLAVPVTAAYFALVGLTWAGALLAKGTVGARKTALGTAGGVALIPLALLLGLWAYIRLWH